MKLSRFLSYEWDAIAGILAATAALILHLFNIVDEHILLSIVLALMALLFINFMRHTQNNEPCLSGCLPDLLHIVGWWPI